MTTSTLDASLDADVIYTDSFDFDSTNIDVAYYDEVSGNLYVQFLLSGVLYQYGGVPASVWNNFKAAGSPGQFYAYSIKGRYARGVQVDARNAVFERREVPVVAAQVIKADRSDKVLVVRITLPANLFEAAEEIIAIGEALEGYDYEAEVV